ncbi:DUF445 domain-containing protein [Bacillus songklensis]|uniref:DUF445 domain-containing protein n=1 Tax=Bacillus songklensis TaxID=1069116 RepID=A0ABV8BAS4_9BACI
MSKQGTKSKYLASFSLGIMGTGFLATIPFQESVFLRLLHGGFEAGVVGGLADWFAVTALFRHPLGLPIPHTALLPKNRQRMTDALVSMLENEWLTKESITDKMKQMNFTEKTLQILEKELHSDTVKKGIVSMLDQMIRHLDMEKASPFIEKEIKKYLYSMKTEEVLQAAVNQALIHGYDEKAVDYILAEAEKWASKKETSNQLGNLASQLLDNIEGDGFLQFALNSVKNFINEEKIGHILQTFILKNISKLRHTDNKHRQALLSRIRQELQDIKEHEEKLKAINGWKDKLVDEWQPAERISGVLRELQQRALTFIQDPQFSDRYVLPFLKRLIDKIKEDPEKMDSLEDWVQKQLVSLIEKNHSKIGKLVRENLDKLDNATLIDMVENNIGKDLQWIRVNGAVCGFVIGLLLEGVKALI